MPPVGFAGTLEPAEPEALPRSAGVAPSSTVRSEISTTRGPALQVGGQADNVGLHVVTMLFTLGWSTTQRC